VLTAGGGRLVAVAGEAAGLPKSRPATVDCGACDSALSHRALARAPGIIGHKHRVIDNGHGVSAYAMTSKSCDSPGP
jgi:hypothetical protein